MGLPLGLVWKLQLVQNVTTRLLMEADSQQHVILLLKHLHWLPMSHQASFNALSILGSGYLLKLIHMTNLGPTVGLHLNSVEYIPLSSHLIGNCICLLLIKHLPFNYPKSWESCS